jgi:hypothetical protein
MRIAIAAVLAGVALLFTIIMAIGALTPAASSPSPSAVASPSVRPSPSAVPDSPEPVTPEPSIEPSPTPTASATPTARPTPTPTARPTPTPAATPTPRPTATATPTPTPTRTPEATATGDDPSDLPRYPGSRLVEVDQGRSGDLTTLKLEYTTPARLDRVRRHYRSMLRHHGWFVGDVEFDHDGWEIEANKGKREASIELKREGNRTEVEIEVSWPSGDRSGGGSGGGGGHSGPGG